jgi:2-methylcitrate dehydratase PrpD
MPEAIVANRPQAAALAPGLGRRLAEWAAGLRYEDLPAPAVTAAKRLLLDTLAVAWAGSDAEGIAPLRAFALAQGGAGESRLWVHGERVPAPQAALVNGAMAAALDFDSVHDVATVHADIVMAPALLALAERGALNGKELITAYVAGDELLVRLGLGIKTHPGWFYTSVLGVFASAAASARALRLDADGILSAMGIALSRSAGTQQALVERALTKRLQSAFAARDGVEAALLAQCGIGAPSEVFEGRCGFEALYTSLDHAAVLAGLGHDYRFPSLTLKKYASCFCNHAAIEATLELVGRHRLAASDIAEASVRISPFMDKLVGSPFSPGGNPQVAAQFSVQYSIATILARGRYSLDDLEPSSVLDPAVGALARRVRVEVDPALPGKFAPATVTLKTRNAMRFEATANELPGTPAHPLSDEEIRVKARACFMRGARPLTAGQSERLVDTVGRLEKLSSLDDLWNPGQE